MAGGASVAAAGNPGDPLSALSGLTAGGALFNVNSGLGGAALLPPANPNSGGVGGNIPHQTFLFETRGDFLDVSKFYGSGYFMDRIGYQPETTVPFPGKFQLPLAQNRGALQKTAGANSKLDKTWGQGQALHGKIEAETARGLFEAFAATKHDLMAPETSAIAASRMRRDRDPHVQ